MATALVKGESRSFEARISELKPNSVLLATDETLGFRERVTVEILGTELTGEVVFSGETGAAVTFQTSPEIFELIEAVESEEDVDIDPDPSIPVFDDEKIAELQAAFRAANGEPEVAEVVDLPTSTLDVVLPEPDPPPSIVARIPVDLTDAGAGSIDLVPSSAYVQVSETGEIKTRHDLDILAHLITLACERPILAKTDHQLDAASLSDVPLEATRLAPGIWALRAKNKAVVEASISLFRGALDQFGGAPAAPTAPTPVPPSPDEVPELMSNDRVQFQTHAHYVVQHEVNLKNGAVVVRSAPLPAGAKKQLHLHVPGAASPVPVDAQVMFQGTGTVGFSITMADHIRDLLERLVTSPETVRVAPPRASSRSSPRLGGPSAEINFRGDLIPTMSAEEMLSFGLRNISSLDEAGGLYPAILSFLLEEDLSAVIKIRGDEDLSIWVYKKRVVFTDRPDADEDDRLGRRLASARAVPRTALASALETQGNRPVGTCLVESGKLKQEALNKALRAQTMSRIALPLHYRASKVEVLPWVDPPISEKLLPVSGPAVMAELFRVLAKTWTYEEACNQLAAHLDRALSIDLQRIASAHRLSSKEQRFFQRIAQTPATVTQLASIGGVSQVEALRLMLLAGALGFGTLTVQEQEDPEKLRAQTQDILMEQLERMKTSSHFDALGIHWSATKREIRSAYDAERKRLMMKNTQGKTRDLVQQLIGKLDVSLKVLETPSSRRQHRDEITEPMERQHASEHLLQQAELALFREAVDEASELLDTADELHVSRRSKQLRKRLDLIRMR